MVRMALDILFDQMDKGQLKLGFAELAQGVAHERPSFRG